MINEFEGEDIFDSRDVEERINELTTEIENETETENSDNQTELAELIKFRDDGNCSEWKDGVTFISEEYFEDYARDFAEDIGAISKDTNWPETCIDWEQAARELQMDYSAVDFGDGTYYYRE